MIYQANIGTATTTFPNTVYNFALWGKSISTAFSNFGWTKSDTGGTGYANWTNVAGLTLATLPTGVGTYEVWTPGDGLTPIYIRIDYYVQNGSPYVFRLVITVGYSTNGTGTVITPTWTSGVIFPVFVTAVPAVYDCDFSGAVGRFAMTLFRGAANPMFFSIERSHDANGNDTSSYFNILANANGTTSQVTMFSPMLAVVENTALAVHTNNVTGINIKAQTLGVTPFWPLVGTLGNPMLGAMCLKSNDLPDGATFSTSIYGSPHTYMCISSAAGNWSPQGNCCAAMRFE